MNRLDELLLLWQDQSISEAELAELKRMLASPENRARAAADFFLTGLLLESVRTQSAARLTVGDLPEPSRVPDRPAAWYRRRWVGAAAAAAVVLLVVGGVLWIGQSPPADSSPAFAQFEQVQGETFVFSKEYRSPAQVGQILKPGQGIATQGAESEAVVQMEDAVRLKLGGDTMVLTATEAEETTGSPRLVLEQGELLVEVTRSLGKKKMTVQTPLGLAIAEIEHTAVHVSDAAGVVVVRGEVNFIHHGTGKSIRLKGGEYVVATPDGELYAAQFFAGEPTLWATFTPGYTDVVSVQFSPAGPMLAAAIHSPDFGIRLGPVDGREPLQLVGDRCLAFSPDGKLLATASEWGRGGNEWGKILLYESASGKLLRTLEKKGPRVRLSCLAFSPDGQALAAGRGTQHLPGDVELWNLTTGELAWSARQHILGVTSLAFSPDGKRLASGSWDKTVVVWDPAARKETTRILMVPALVVRSLAFAPNGRTLAIATGPIDARFRVPGDIRLWDVATESVRSTLHGHTRVVTSIAYSADGRTLVSGSADTTVRFWDLTRNRQYGMLKGHRAAVGFEGIGVALSGDDSWLATASLDRTVKLWRVTWMRRDNLTRLADRPSEPPGRPRLANDHLLLKWFRGNRS